MHSPTQTWNADDYAKNARFVSDLGQVIVDLLAPEPGERVLDLGCGDGALTERVARTGARVVGIDAAPDFIAAARARGLDARLMDATSLTFAAEFDAVYTNAVLHWVADKDAAVAGVRRALRPEGRFVGEFGGHGCVAAIATAIQAVCLRRGVTPAMPWHYSTVDAFTAVLERQGFRPVTVQLIARPTLLPSGMAAWLRTFAGSMFAALPEHEREPALAEAVDLLRFSLVDEHGNWIADYTRLRFSAVAE